MQIAKYKHKLIATALAVVFVVVDFVTKQLALEFMPKNTTLTIIPGLIDFRFLFNDGAAFGILDQSRWVFMLSTVVFLIVGTIYFIYLDTKKVYLAYVIATIFAGGVGNMIDRVTTGQVIDFITFGFFDFPSFNFADCCVVVGCFMWIGYLIYEIIIERKLDKNE